jgi:radical SAM superfamily enzyme YgiQ (UPF0313 family)
MSAEFGAVLINPGDRKQVFQGLGKEYAAIEPPYWTAVIAAFLRNQGYNVGVIDSDAENITPEETAAKVADMKPFLSVVIAHGSTPASSTLNMNVSGRICRAIREVFPCKIALSGIHPTALPEQTMKEEEVDYIVEGEGPITIRNLLEALKSKTDKMSNVKGLWYRENGIIKNNPRAPLADNLDVMLPVAAWDLLPMPVYRSHFWHSFDNIKKRSPYVSLYTSLGCAFNCSFCCINTLFGKPGIRYRSPEIVIDEIDLIVNKYGVRNIKLSDELFVFKEDHYMKIVDMIIERGYDLNIWAWARVDSVKLENLEKMKKAGINWLVFGIESANQAVRKGVNKRIKTDNVVDLIQKVRTFGINIVANYMFGLPDDTLKSMQETMDQAMELNAEMANLYCTMAYPGAQLYEKALKEGWELPKTWQGYSQHSYETTPLPTKYLSAKEVLKFRDDAFNTYFTNPKYLEMIRTKFGRDAHDYMVDITKIKLKRKLLGD